MGKDTDKFAGYAKRFFGPTVFAVAAGATLAGLTLAHDLDVKFEAPSHRVISEMTDHGERYHSVDDMRAWIDDIGEVKESLKALEDPFEIAERGRAFQQDLMEMCVLSRGVTYADQGTVPRDLSGEICDEAYGNFSDHAQQVVSDVTEEQGLARTILQGLGHAPGFIEEKLSEDEAPEPPTFG